MIRFLFTNILKNRRTQTTLPFSYIPTIPSNTFLKDFQGPYTVSTSGFMAFGPPTRSLPLKLSNLSSYDQTINNAKAVYDKRMHNICCDNCHSHVCCALNEIEYKGFKKWNMVILAFWIFLQGRFRSWGDVVKTFGPSVVFWGIVAAFMR